MKITWFGGNVFRLYVGGRIIVTDADKPPAHIDLHELTAGADELISITDVLPGLTPFARAHWAGRKRKSMLDEETPKPPVLHGIDGKCLIVDSADEGRLIAAFGQIEWDRFADEAVVVLAGRDAVGAARAVLNVARPKLIALAVAELDEALFEKLGAACDNCALQVLEPGFALEA